MKSKLFKPIPEKYRKKYDCCISVSFFKMIKGGYRKSSYIQMFLSWVNFIPKNCFIRMYIDQSAFKDPEFLQLLDVDIPLEIYMFEDKRFLLEDGIHHDGTFGTMARFLSLFDEKLDVDYVWITDLDITYGQVKPHYLSIMNKRNIDVQYRSESCYARFWVPKEVDYPVINDRIIIQKNKVKISKVKFNKFLKEVYENKFVDLKNKIEAVRVRLSGQDIRKFTYGFDEYYTNNILYKEMLNYERLIYYGISLQRIDTQYKGIIKNYQKLSTLEEKLWRNPNKDLNLLQKKEQKIARKFIEEQKEKFQDSYRIKKCVRDFDLYEDKLDFNENFTTIILLPPKD